MMFPIVGTIKNAVKMTQMEQKWQQKKQKGSLKKEPLNPEERQMQAFKEDIEQMNKSRKMSYITTKLKAGGMLTSDEIEYLRKNNPELLREYEELCREKEAFERELRACKTKEDAEKLKMVKLESLAAQAKKAESNPCIPKSAKLGIAEKLLRKANALQKVFTKFVKSDAYRNLPTEAEEAEERKQEAEMREEQISELKPDMPKMQEENQESETTGEQKETEYPEETLQDIPQTKERHGQKSNQSVQEYTRQTAQIPNGSEASDVMRFRKK